MPINQLDLCSGIGAGFPLAATQLGGFNLVGLCECDEWCQSILKLRYPGIPIISDVKRYDFSSSNKYHRRYTDIDLVTASPPCPPFSIEGKRRGADDERDCFPAVTHAIAKLQPRFFTIENVTGLLNCPYKPGAERSYFRYVLGYLSQFGFDCEWTCVSSGHFSAPFRRERLLLVGVSRRLKLKWESATPWTDQIREQVEESRIAQERRGTKPGFPKQFLQSPEELPRTLGVPNRSAITRRQREAAGNLLDPRVAAVALRRVLYLNSLTET